MEWELSKENVQPLRKGRKDVELLNEGLKAKMEAPVKCALAEQRRALLEAIDAYTGGDPLQPWLECIGWTKEAFPSGGSQSGILPMLELCLRTFCKDPKYCDDIRYLKLWMDYADRCTDARDIYKFLEANDIGQTHALFYEAYAHHMESLKNYSKANDIFNLGISRLPESEEIKMKYKGFLERRSRATIDEDDNAEEGCVRAFGTLSIHQPAGRSARTSGRASQDINRPTGAPLSNKKFSVFVDSKFQPGPKRLPTEQREAVPGWTSLGTQAERGKENVQQPSKWTETKVPLKSPARAPPSGTLDVFVDEELTAKYVRPTKRIMAGTSLKARFSHAGDLKQDAETLKHAPLRNFQNCFR